MRTPADGHHVLIDERIGELRLRSATGSLTIRYAARDREHNHAVILLEVLRYV